MNKNPALLRSTLTCTEYGRNAFESYIDHYGRDSGRKDLLTKFITVKSDVGDDPLSDQEIYTEIANLVFAGTGK